MDPKDNIFNRPEKDLANAMRRIDLVNQALQPFNSIQTTYNLINRLQMQQWYVEKWTEPYTNLMKQLNLSNNLANSVTNYMDNINRLRQSLSDIMPINAIETLDSYETLRNSIEHNFVSFDPEKRYKILKKSLFDLDDCFEDLSNSETEDDIEACEKKMEECIKDLTQTLKIKDAEINQLKKELIKRSEDTTKGGLLKKIKIASTIIAILLKLSAPNSSAPMIDVDYYHIDNVQIMSEEMTQTPEPTLEPTPTAEPTPTSENNN